jgi:hypothetical protein
MTKAEKFAYRGTLRGFFAVCAAILAAGLIGDLIGGGRGNFEKAEGFIADMHAIATQVPRSLDGSVVRQGELSTAWLDDVGALPARFQAMAGSLRGGEDQRTLGLIRRGPWSFSLPIETRDSLVWTQLSSVPKAICVQFARAIAGHPDQVGYISSSGNPPVVPTQLRPDSLCNSNFNNFALITLDPPTEVRRLSADIENAVKKIPANSTEKMPISGSSAPFQVNTGQDGGPGFIQRDESEIRVTINNVPFAVCRLVLRTGPKAFGMDSFHAADGKIAPSPVAPAAATLCNDLKGHLIMSRR